MSSTTGLDPRPALRIALLVIGLTAMVATVVALAFARDARAWLGFGFGGVPANLGQALSIFLNNAHLLVAVAIAALLQQVGLRVTPDRRPPVDPRLLRALSRLCEGVLSVNAAINVAIVGAALGAYGWRMVVSILPHGPVELMAYCFALGFYLDARRRPLPRRAWLAPILASVSLLAIAALLETFAPLG